MNINNSTVNPIVIFQRRSMYVQYVMYKKCTRISLTNISIHSSYSIDIVPVYQKPYYYLRDDEHFSFCAYYIGASSLLRRMCKSQDKNDDVEVAVLYVVAFLL